MKITGAKVKVDIAIPVYNEDRVLEHSVNKLRKFITGEQFKNYQINLIVVNNASTDNTEKIGKKLADRYKNIKYIFLPEKGRGRALRECWEKSKAEIVAYMDVDLSAELEALENLLKAITKDKYDISIGSRLKKGSRVEGRTLMREVMSRGYNFLISLLFNVGFEDAQCGFKAISRKSFVKLEPLIQNQNWFFDSEMLIIANQMGMKIKEIPLSWKDDPTSTVKVATTAYEDMAGLWRLKREKPWKR